MEVQEPFSTHLPIYKYRQKIIQTIRKNMVTVICGQTGSGKTTQLPQYLMHDSQQNYQRIMISQPRRISAISLAQRVVSQTNTKIGEEIGYSVRFEEKRDLNEKKSRVLFVTDGMAIRQMMVGRTYEIYVVDQAHERSINTDVFLAVLKGMLDKTKQMNLDKKKKNFKIKPFKIVIMSATIDTQKFCQFFDTDAVINVEGRSYPTHIYNVFDPVSDYVSATFNTILQIHDTEHEGDILAFLTGEQEIVTLKNQLNSALKYTDSDMQDQQNLDENIPKIKKKKLKPL